jgi:hypothetical protein
MVSPLRTEEPIEEGLIIKGQANSNISIKFRVHQNLCYPNFIRKVTVAFTAMIVDNSKAEKLMTTKRNLE